MCDYGSRSASRSWAVSFTRPSPSPFPSPSLFAQIVVTLSVLVSSTSRTMSVMNASQETHPAQMQAVIAELRMVQVMADLPEEQMVWLAQHASLYDFEAGDVVAAEGAPAAVLLALVHGEMRGRREQRDHGAADTWLYVWKGGEVGGALPYSRLKIWPVTSRATAPSRVAMFPASILEELPVRMPVLAERLVHVM